MHIVLEGCDGAGKSTLADAVQTEIERRSPGEEIIRIHSSQLLQDPLDEYALAYEFYRPGTGKHYIIDRLHWGETIYGPLYRGGSAVSLAQFRWIEMFLKARGSTTFHVTASLETIENRLRTRGEDFLQPRDVQRVWEDFRDVAENALTTGGSLYTDRISADKAARLIVNEAVYSETTALESFTPEYIGRALPSVLLVGDEQGPTAPGVTEAAFLPRGPSSGVYLLNSLPDLWWHQVGIVNSADTDLPTLIDNLYYPSIVALGLAASERLEAAGVAHSVAPHPQKIRRFHNAMSTEYGSLIRDVSTEKRNELSWPKSQSTT